MPRPISKGLPPGIQKQIDAGDLKANLGNSHLVQQVLEYMGEGFEGNIVVGTDGDELLQATDNSDIFVLTAGNDTISGFSLTDDRIDISGLLNDTDPSGSEPSEIEESEETSVGTDSGEDAAPVEETSDGALTDYSALIAGIIESAANTAAGADTAGVILTFPSGGSLLLEGITTADLSESMFTASTESSEDPLGSSSEDTLSEDAASTVFRLYKAAFAREPDEDGLKFWVDKANKGLEVAKIATGFMESEEFSSTYGENVSNAVFIENLYINILGRAGDEDGTQFWEDHLDNGGAKEDALLGFANSEENIVDVQQDMQAYDMM